MYTTCNTSQVHSLPLISNIKKKIFDALVTQTETEFYHLCKEKGICEEHNGFLYDLLHSQCNQISSSAHSSVVQRHVELSVTWFFFQRRREVSKT